MDNPDQSALYQVFQESFSKQLVGSSYPDYNQQSQQPQQPQVQNVWPPPVHQGVGGPPGAVPATHNPYPGAELDFPNPDLGAMRGQIPPTNFYGQEFYDMQPQQPQSMQGYYENPTNNSLMGMQPQPQPPRATDPL